MAVCWHFHGNMKDHVVVQLGLKTGSTGMDIQYAPKKGDTKFANASCICAYIAHVHVYIQCAHISSGNCVVRVLSRSIRVVPQP